MTGCVSFDPNRDSERFSPMKKEIKGAVAHSVASEQTIVGGELREIPKPVFSDSENFSQASDISLNSVAGKEIAANFRKCRYQIL